MKTTFTIIGIGSVILLLSVPQPGNLFAQRLENIIFPVSSAFQMDVEEGTSVATGAIYHVVGKPGADFDGFYESGSVEIYDAVTHLHLFSIKNPDPADHDRFGTSVAVSGSVVLVGSHFDDGPINGSVNAGTVYVYDLSAPGPPIPVWTLSNPRPNSNDRFGWSVAIAGTLIVVGADRDDNAGFDGGAVYVYDLNSFVPPNPIQTIDNPSGQDGGNFGFDVAVAGQHIFASAPLAIDKGNFGLVYVYSLTSKNPDDPVYRMVNPNEMANGKFGMSLNASNNILTVGDPADSSTVFQGGSAFAFDLESADPTLNFWQKNAAVVGTNFGRQVSISGNKVLVASGVTSSKHQVDVFDLSSQTPTISYATLLSPGDGHLFASAMSIFEDEALVSDPLDDTTAVNAGAAHVFDVRPLGSSTPITTLTTPTPGSGDWFGASVAMSSHLVVIGSPKDSNSDFDAGAFYVYDKNNFDPANPLGFVPNFDDFSRHDKLGENVAAWEKIVVASATGQETTAVDEGAVYVYDFDSDVPTVPALTINNPDPDDDDFFGNSIAISENIIVIGTALDDAAANNAGAAYVYDLFSGDPSSPSLTLIDPAPGAQNEFGNCVAVSGGIIAVGAHRNDKGAVAAGSVFVYNFSAPNPTTPIASLHHPPMQAGALFGGNLAMDGSILAVGAPGEDTLLPDVGAVYVFDIASASPTTPIAVLSNPKVAEVREFGVSVSVSGSRIAVGGKVPGPGNNHMGVVFVYDLSSIAPYSPIAVLDDPTPLNSQFGAAISMVGNSLLVGAFLDDSLNTDQGSARMYSVSPISIFAESVSVTRGVIQAGGINELSLSDNTDFSVTRDPALVQAIIEMTVKGNSVFAMPAGLTVTLEASVFSRGEIEQSIELFNYDSGSFEMVDVRAASRFVDQVTSIPVAGDVARFVDKSSGCIEARIHFRSSSNRQQFTANVDQVIWELE